MEERWSFHAQATAVGQSHGKFTSPYQAGNSLKDREEIKASLTATFFLGARMWKGGELYLTPELAGGRGLSNVVGIAGFPNGDITRVVKPVPRPYLSRIFYRQTWGLAGGTESLEGGPGQLAGRRPVSRATLTVGKISLPDLFDVVTYSHDPRGQFMGWALINGGAFDYPADTRGYTWGVAAELNVRRWALRAGIFEVPQDANGIVLDRHWRRNHGEVFEGEERHRLGGRAGRLSLLSFITHANMGTYRLALLQKAPPDITLTRRSDTSKYGFGVNAEQAVAGPLGAFMRLGWDDGKTESWAYTEIDRTVALGLEATGRKWRRADDTVGVAKAISGLSGDHRRYLAAGGSGFILGDGRLTYSRESNLEAFYGIKVNKTTTVTLDFQHVRNPGFNRDRGPVSVWGLRLHWEM